MGNISSENTKAYIVQSLFFLMQTKDFNKIQITEIVEKAGVGRSTFYKYFKDKKDIIKFHLISQRDIFRKQNPLESNTTEELQDTLVKILSFINENKYFMGLIFKQNLNKLFLDFCNETFKDVVFNQSNVSNKYIPIIVSGAFYNLLYYWYLNDFEDTAEEIAQLLEPLSNISYNYEKFQHDLLNLNNLDGLKENVDEIDLENEDEDNE